MTTAAYKHHLPPQFLPPIQQVFRQHHARGPELSAAAFFEVFVEVEGRVEAAGEGERGYAGGFGGAGGEEVFGDVEGEGRGGHFEVVGRVAGR